MLSVIKIKNRIMKTRKMKKEHEGISKQINNLLSVNIFDNVRKMENVDARALYCYILRKDLKYTLHTVKDIFNANGKRYDHSTVYYNVNLFQEVRERRPEMELIRDTILKEVNPKYALLKIIENTESDEILEQFYECINNLENETRYERK